MPSYANFNRKLEDRYKQWMVIQHYSLGTQYSYKQSVRLFVDFLKRKSVTDVTYMDVRRFLLQLSEEGASLISVRKHLQTLRQFYDFLNLGGLVDYVPARMIRIRPDVHKPPRHLSRDEMCRLTAAAVSSRDKAIVQFLYSTGARVTETRMAKVQDLNLESRTARVTGKYGKSRVVLLTENAAAALSGYLRGRTDGYLFQQDYPPQTGTLTSSNGVWVGRWRDYDPRNPRGVIRRKYLGNSRMISYKRAKAKFQEVIADARLTRPKPDRPLSAQTILNVLRNLGRRSGLKYINAHMIRHTFATHLYENGADLISIQTLLGHAELHTTSVYARPSAFRLVEAFERAHPDGLYQLHNSTGESDVKS
jgi:integrase/recombinase XerD